MRTLILASLLLASLPAQGFVCAKKDSASVFSEADEVVLIYVIGTKLEEKLARRLFHEHPEDIEREDVKLISASYRVIESLKGPSKFRPKLLEVLGVGTGYVGLQSGAYYLLALEEDEEGLQPKMRWVNTCSILASHYRWEAPGFQEELTAFRKQSSSR